jgi:hypothetical protein
MLLESLERRDVSPTTPALWVLGAQGRSVTSTTIQANNARCHAGRCLSPRSVPVEVADEPDIAAR